MVARTGYAGSNDYVKKHRMIETATTLNYAVLYYVRDDASLRQKPRSASGSRMKTESCLVVAYASIRLLTLQCHD